MKRIVIKVAMKGKKSRSKAMEIVGRLQGLQSVTLAGPDSNNIVVIGEGIDSVKLTKLLRKKVGPSELVSGGPVEYGTDSYSHGYSGSVHVPSAGYYSHPNYNAYGPGQGHGYLTMSHYPYPYGPGYVYPETYHDNPNRCSIM